MIISSAEWRHARARHGEQIGSASTRGNFPACELVLVAVVVPVVAWQLLVGRHVEGHRLGQVRLLLQIFDEIKKLLSNF